MGSFVLRVHFSGAIALALLGVVTASRTNAEDLQRTAASDISHNAPLHELGQFRNGIASRQGPTLAALALMPGTPWLLPGLDEEQVLRAMRIIWGPFFENVITEHLNLGDGSTRALYYNPLLDAAVLTSWEQVDGSSKKIAEISAIPGEYLGPEYSSSLVSNPQWMIGTDPVGTLIENAQSRLAAFRSSVRTDEVADRAYEAAVDGLRAIIPRLRWQVAHRSGWLDKKWINPLLSSVEDDLSLEDPEELLARVPQSDRETAVALAELDDDFSLQIRLSLVLEQEQSRVVVLSSPLDGRYYLFVRCDLTYDTSTCVPFQYIWIDVMGSSS